MRNNKKKIVTVSNEEEKVGAAQFTIEPSFYILLHSYDMPVRIACNGLRHGAHTLWRMHHRCQHIDCKIALQIGCPWTLVLRMSNKQQRIPCLSEHSLPSS
jgi:hypothetical protein